MLHYVLLAHCSSIALSVSYIFTVHCIKFLFRQRTVNTSSMHQSKSTRKPEELPTKMQPTFMTITYTQCQIHDSDYHHGRKVKTENGMLSPVTKRLLKMIIIILKVASFLSLY
jgi:hypothetical protein